MLTLMPTIAIIVVLLGVVGTAFYAMYAKDYL